MEEKLLRIDVHNHIIPSEYLRELAGIGITDSLGRSFPEWSAEKTLAVMDANGIRAAVTSISSPGVYFGDAPFARRAARLCNEVSAQLVSDYPARFGAFATLPLPDAASSLDELSYALDTLRLDGVVVLSNIAGTYVGDERYETLYAELDRRHAVAYVHPTDPAAGNPLGKEIPTFLMEVTFDTARAIFNLLYKGVLERYPNIRWIFSHAGGVLPYLTWRISLGQFVLPDAGKAVPKGVPWYLQRLFYDTGLSANPYVFRSLRELVDPSQILFGTDYPFAPGILSAETVKGLHAYDGFSAEELKKIEYGNALALFPRLAQPPRVPYKKSIVIIPALSRYGSIHNKAAIMILQKFKDLGLSDTTLEELRKKGFEEPTEIQEKTIPVMLSEDVDIIGQAQTGTGKTAAFGLPLLEMLKENTRTIQALVLVPTRELAIQVSEEINSFRGSRKFQIIPVYGGQSMSDQLMRLRKGVDIVVGTPGRVFDHIRRKSIVLGNVSFVVLDEADEMLNMGFIEEVEEILKQTNPGRRTLLFSATMPARVMEVAKRHMREYRLIAMKKDRLTVDLTDQIYFEVAPSDRLETLCRIIDMEKEFYGLVFCRTKVEVDGLAGRLIDRGYNADGIHGDLSQFQRERMLDKFRKRQITILAATDVAARGIDVVDLTHVINYSLPQNADSYIHRIGRTGRAGKKGVAVTFISPNEYRQLMFIAKFTKTAIRKERIPRASEIVSSKLSGIREDLDEIIQNMAHEEYIKTAILMIKGNDPIDVVAALLKYTLDDELNQSKYKDIKEFKEVSVDNRGTARLFISVGKKDGLDPRKLLKLINNQAKVPAGKISEIKVMNTYSFLTAPFKEAEIILQAFKEKKGETRPIVKRADVSKMKSTKKSYKKKK